MFKNCTAVLMPPVIDVIANELQDQVAQVFKEDILDKEAEQSSCISILYQQGY